jgi:hypothetical protein
MGEKRRRSKKRSTSNNQPLLKGFTLYLCNCVDYDEVVNALDRGGIRYQRHRNHFPPDVADTELLRKVGQRRWILITADKRQRLNPLERQAIVQYRVRQFVIVAPSIGSIGELLLSVRGKVRNICKKNAGPFVAAISAAGIIKLRSLDGIKPTLFSN